MVNSVIEMTYNLHN